MTEDRPARPMPRRPDPDRFGAETGDFTIIPPPGREPVADEREEPPPAE